MKTNRVQLRYVRRLTVSAFTVLDCSKCSHRVYLEAHHVYGTGKVRRFGRAYSMHLKARRRMLADPLTCPKCACPAWTYIRTEVADVHGIYVPLSS